MKNGLNTEGWYSGAAQPEPRLESNWKSAARPEIAVHRHSPSNLAEQEHICAEEWPIIPQSKCGKLTATNLGWCRLYFLPKRLWGLGTTWKKNVLTTTIYHCKYNKTFKPLLIIHCTMFSHENKPIFFGLRKRDTFKMAIKVLIMKELLWINY